MRSSRLNASILWALVAASLAGSPASVSSARDGDGRVAREYELKAAFLFNLAKFVTWPAGKPAAGDTFVIAVLGEEAAPEFQRILQNKTLDQRKLAVRRCVRADEVRGAGVVFVSRTAGRESAEAIRLATSESILCVGETEQFLEQGGMVRFYVEQEQLRLEVEAQRLREAGLSITSNALSSLVSKGIARVRNSQP